MALGNEARPGFFETALLVAGTFLLVVSALTESLRTFLFGAGLLAFVFTLHWRMVAGWVLGVGLLIWFMGDSLMSAVLGPGTMLAVLSSILNVLVALLLLLIWWRHRSHFRVTRPGSKQ